MLLVVPQGSELFPTWTLLMDQWQCIERWFTYDARLWQVTAKINIHSLWRIKSCTSKLSQVPPSSLV